MGLGVLLVVYVHHFHGVGAVGALWRVNDEAVANRSRWGASIPPLNFERDQAPYSHWHGALCCV